MPAGLPILIQSSRSGSFLADVLPGTLVVPLATGDVAGSSSMLAGTAEHHVGHSGSARTLAWLLDRSPAMLLIPGTGSIEHIRENIEAALIQLSQDHLLALRRSTERSS